MKRVPTIAYIAILGIFAGYNASAQSGNNHKSDNYKTALNKSDSDSVAHSEINNYYIDNNYSSDLERFDEPSTGLGYYDYMYSPGYYWGGDDMDFGYGYGYDGDPYWGWDFGWGMCGYYNSCYGRYGVYGYGGCGWGGRGFHGWGHGFGGRGGGYGNFGSHGGYAGNGGYYFGSNHQASGGTLSGLNAHSAVPSSQFNNAVNAATVHANQSGQFTGTAKNSVNTKVTGLSGGQGWKAVPPKGWNSASNRSAGSNNINSAASSQPANRTYSSGDVRPSTATVTKSPVASENANNSKTAQTTGNKQTTNNNTGWKSVPPAGWNNAQNKTGNNGIARNGNQRIQNSGGFNNGSHQTGQPSQTKGNGQYSSPRQGGYSGGNANNHIPNSSAYHGSYGGYNGGGYHGSSNGNPGGSFHGGYSGGGSSHGGFSGGGGGHSSGGGGGGGHSSGGGGGGRR